MSDLELTLNAQSKRAEARERVLKGAKLVYDGGVLDCAVLDISTHGARVSMANPTPLPEMLTLHLNGGAIYPARRRWARGREAGFEFLQQSTLTTESKETALVIYESLRDVSPSRVLTRLRAERCFDDAALTALADDLDRAYMALAAALYKKAGQTTR